MGYNEVGFQGGLETFRPSGGPTHVRTFNLPNNVSTHSLDVISTSCASTALHGEFRELKLGYQARISKWSMSSYLEYVLYCLFSAAEPLAGP